jgi:hypothetical protein
MGTERSRTVMTRLTRRITGRIHSPPIAGL